MWSLIWFILDLWLCNCCENGWVRIHVVFYHLTSLHRRECYRRHSVSTLHMWRTSTATGFSGDLRKKFFFKDTYGEASIPAKLEGMYPNTAVYKELGNWLRKVITLPSHNWCFLLNARKQFLRQICVHSGKCELSRKTWELSINAFNVAK